MDNSLVSIIVPVYNTAGYIEECIQSILAQTYRPVELILVNDGSTDASGDICRQYGISPNVKYIKQDHMGTVAARKRGLNESRGEWVMFVDSDDLLLKDATEKMLHQSAGADIVVGSEECFSSRLSISKATTYLEWDEYLYGLYNKAIYGTPWAKMFRRELVVNSPQAFDYPFVAGEDFIMNLAIARINRKKVTICKSEVYYYRKRLDSTVHTFNYTFDYYARLCSVADSLVKGYLPEDKYLKAGISCRMTYYRTALGKNGLQANNRHPLVEGLESRMNQAKVLRITDRMLLRASSRRAVKFCYYLLILFKMIRKPSLAIDYIERKFNR